jgi:regulator of replication initiation timing
MLGNIFKKDDDEKREMAEGMQSMSDQIGALSKQLAEKSAEIERLQAAAKSATSDTAALQAARQQVDDLQKQLHELQRKMAEEQATREAEAMAADLISKQKAKEVASAPASSGGLAIGNTAYVTRAGGMPLRLRTGAGLNSDIRDRLQPGTEMKLLEGPHLADNHAWWRIRTTDGREGWVAGEELRTQPD